MSGTENLSRQSDFADLIDQQEFEVRNSSQSREWIVEELSRFNAYLIKLLQPGSPEGTSFLAFTRYTLNKFRLGDLHSETSILNEAYLRGVSLIEKGRVIKKPIPWLRATSFRIVQELHRSEQRTELLANKMSAEYNPWLEIEKADDEADYDFSIEKLKSAFQSLTLDEQRLLSLRIVKGASWGEIRETLKLQDGIDYSEITLRKRKQRALMRLRKAYHLAINNPDME